MQPIGQILPGTGFGDALTLYAASCDTIVEIGVWRGGGSTACLHNAMTRPEQRLFCVDIMPEMIGEARARYKDDHITWLCGSVFPVQGAELVKDKLPAKIDFLLIDGGHDCGRDDFNALAYRCKIIALDDVTQVKNNVNYRKLRDEWQWKTLASSLTERLGWAIFERP